MSFTQYLSQNNLHVVSTSVGTTAAKAFGDVMARVKSICASQEGSAEFASVKETEGRDSLAVPYGSYHQLYRIDGRLVAVGVVDILPKCLVSPSW